MKTIAIATTMLMCLSAFAQEDPYLWLEDVAGPKQLEWVKAQNALTRPVLEATPDFKQMQARMLGIATSRERIPSVVKRGDFLYNHWQDATTPRGLLRRTTLDEYRKRAPHWEPVLDITRLSAEEKVNWVYKAAECLYPEYRRCLISLSRGGADAVEVREFDMVSKEFVKDGFHLAEAKQDVGWVDADTLYVASDFGPGSLTRSGYARIVKQWKRGTPIAEAKTLYEGKEDDAFGVFGFVVNEPGRSYHRIRREMGVRYGEDFILHGGKWVRVDAPRDADVSTFNGMLMLRLRSDWKPVESCRCRLCPGRRGPARAAGAPAAQRAGRDAGGLRRAVIGPNARRLVLALEQLWVYTSRGTGYWRPPLRFGAPSETTRLRFMAG